jgi:uncharacterized protein
MRANPICWFEIHVDDMVRARRFYEAVLQIELEPLADPDGDIEMLAFPGGMDRFGAPGVLAKVPGCAPGRGGALVYFACTDCARPAARVEAAGGRVERPKHSIGEYGYIAVAVDTEGNPFGLHSTE